MIYLFLFYFLSLEKVLDIFVQVYDAFLQQEKKTSFLFMVYDTFNNISVISWQSVLSMKEARVL